MKIQQIAHYANDITLAPGVRQMYWTALRELSKINQSLLLYESAVQNYRKQLDLEYLSQDGRERLTSGYERSCRIAGELKWRRIFLEAFTPCTFSFNPVDASTVGLNPSLDTKIVEEEEKLKTIQELRQTLEKLSDGSISFSETRPIFDKYFRSQN